jgi:hypothetical protein
MNLAVLIRDMSIGMRTRAFAAALAVHVALLAAFIVLWDGGVPMLPGANVYEQQRLLQTSLLVCLLPWAAVRCAPSDRGDEMVLLSAITGDRPSRIVTAQFAARAVLLAAIALSGLPLMLVAGDLAAQPLARPLTDVVPVLALATMASCSSVWWTLGHPDRLTAWLGATASTGAAVVLVGLLLPPGTMAAGFLAISIAGAAVAASRSDASLRYLSERPA